MSVVKETLKVNDELSVDIDVIYRNGEKYARSRSQYELLRLLYYVYCDALSDHINNEQYVLSDDPPDLSLWDIWNENKWKKYKNQYIEFRTWDEANIYIYGDQYGLDGNSVWHHFMPDINGDVMFPFSLCDDGRYHSDEFVHFDIFIFALYLEYPQYKNDLIRFLKYQPVCTKTTDELYIYNLKQTNKDLLKQLNETNDKLSELEAKLKASEDKLKHETEKYEELNSSIAKNENKILQLNDMITKANEENVVLNNIVLDNTAQLATMKKENVKVLDENATLKEELEAAKKQNAELSKKIEAFRNAAGLL